MRPKTSFPWPLTILFLFLVMAGPLSPQEKQKQTEKQTEKQTVMPSDYGKWESLGSSSPLSPDGRWLACPIRRVNGKNELRLHALDAEGQKVFPQGQSPAFSADSQWLAYQITLSQEQEEKLKKAGKPVQNKLGLHDLKTGKTIEFESVASFSFSEDGKFLAMRRYPSKGRKGSGVDLVVRDLAEGTDTCFGNVSRHAFCEVKPLLAMTIDTEDKLGNGVQLYDLASGRLRTLDSSRSKYKSLLWREDAADLAVLRENVSHVLLTWRLLGTEKPLQKIYDHRGDEGFTKGMYVVDDAGLRWSEDGQTVFFGIKEKKASAEDGTKENAGAGKKPKQPAEVEVWHAKDIDIQPRQKKKAEQDKKKNYLCAWWIEAGAFVQLGNELTEGVRLLRGQKHALGTDHTPYERERMFGPTLVDAYIIDVRTGAREKIQERVKHYFNSDPTGRYFLYIKNGNFWTYDLQEKKHHDLTGELQTHFTDQELSWLTDEKPPYGIAGWSKDGSEVLLHDRYDLWSIRADGTSAKRLTDGAKDRIEYRYLELDPKARSIDLDKPLYLGIYGDRSKKYGFARIVDGGAPEQLVFLDKSLDKLAKAKKAEVYAYVAQGFDDSPDVFVAGPDLRHAKQATRTNPFQKDYLWGRSELLDFESARGEPLQGGLYYPAGYEPGKRYPMIVNVYELRSQGVHWYEAPSEREPYNLTVYTSQGYFVFQPDIVYRAQNPGLSAVECVVPAVKKACESGMIDAKRIGLVGHSWGAYQTAFIVTQTDLFAAAAAGAPLTNLMSMSVSVYWHTGQADAWMFHEAQGRMDKPFWRDLDTFVRNSPIFQMDKLKTPLLITFGDKDGFVDWHQGIEMYNAGRLAQKQLVMLVYPGEGHGLRKKPNQLDYHRRILDWFGHYLQGKPAPKWILEGKSYLEREDELERARKTKKKAESK